jgi:hypothetical protein
VAVARHASATRSSRSMPPPYRSSVCCPGVPGSVAMAARNEHNRRYMWSISSSPLMYTTRPVVCDASIAPPATERRHAHTAGVTERQWALLWWCRVAAVVSRGSREPPRDDAAPLCGPGRAPSETPRDAGGVLSATSGAALRGPPRTRDGHRIYIYWGASPVNPRVQPLWTATC